MEADMEQHNDKKKKRKPKKIAKRKGKKRQQIMLEDDVEEVIDLVNGLKPPGFDVEDTQSQPQSRRGSSMTNSMPTQYLLNPQEVARRASDFGALKSSNEEEISNGEEIERRDSIENYTTTVRGSTKRGSVTLRLEEEEAEMNLKRMKETLQAMETKKRAQKEFCWDSVSNRKVEEDEPPKSNIR